MRGVNTLWLCLLLTSWASGCTTADAERFSPDEAGATRAVQTRLGDIKTCWKETDARFDHAVAPRLTVHVETNGASLLTFAHPAHRRHPLGACILSHLDDITFTPPTTAQHFVLPVDFTERPASTKETSP